MTQPRITLALGGGGARGAAHLGAIEAILDAGLSVERVVGVSIGSLMGAAWAVDPDISRVQQRMLQFLMSPTFQNHQQTMFGTRGSGDTDGGRFTWYERVKGYLNANRMFHRVLTRPSMLPGIILHDVVDHLVPDVDVADTKIPLSIVAVDLRSGHRVVIENGSARDAVRASSSLPGIFPPVEFGDMLLCDIGVFNSLPTIVADSYSPEYTIAVDVSSGVRHQQEFDTAFDVMMRMDTIGEAMFRKYVRPHAELVIKPDVHGIEWFDFSASADLIEIGRDAARRALREVRIDR